MKRFKCKLCHKLLFVIAGLKPEINAMSGVHVAENMIAARLEIKCPKCKKLNIFTREQVTSV